MIAAALDLIRGQLDAALRKAEARADGWVILSNLVEPDGRPLAAADGKLVLTLTNISHAPVLNAPSSGALHAPSPPSLDLTVLVCAHFHGPAYTSGLTAIARTIDFFHRTPIFTKAVAPTLDPAVEQIRITPNDLDFTALAAVVAMHGGRYLPSVCYTVRVTPK